MPNPTIYSDQVQFENPQKLRWQDSALCAQTDPEIYFPAKGKERVYNTARKFCGRCLVRSNCLEDIMEREGNLPRSERWGMVAGLTPQERWDLYLARNDSEEPREEIERQKAA